ncbi:acyltransferase family protein [Frateuria sp. YIM B11624]|uniref:acyltransferase family protein n=1 Tax=Frateuria sp. YIM B11624 TaxID=3143185 RepID=UPI003C74918D
MIPKYRADIDGLRAVAVLSVLLYHAGSGFFSGGYVGVDIFFVISGYLITTIIVREVEAGGFSIASFYERRARRILPALAVVVLATLVAGAFLLTPHDLEELGGSAVATALFSSNVLFYLTSGYFDGPAETKPLLHTWSLAVEEQYYIFFPLLVLLIARFGARRYLRWLLGLGLLSFLACALVTRIDASAAFYLIPTRAWELFIGSVLSLKVVPEPTTRRTREAVAALGAALIAWAICLYTPDTDFPGVAAAVPTLGAALIIHAGTGGTPTVSRLLSLRPVVFIGLVSYSLYLWHWPVIVFVRLYLVRAPDAAGQALMIAASFALAVLSWRYVEAPFRTKKLFARTTPMLGAAASTLAILLCTGLALWMSRGLPQRPFASAVTDVDPSWDHWGECEDGRDSRAGLHGLCDLGVSRGAASFMLWGDSHARALAAGVNQSAARHGLRGKFIARSACPPLLGVDRAGRTSCNAFNQAVLRMLSQAPQIRTVLLTARWTLSADGTRYTNESGHAVRLVDLKAKGDGHRCNAAIFETGLRRTISQLQRLGKQVVLVRTIPEIGYDVPAAYMVARLTGRDTNALVSPTLGAYRDRTREVTVIFDRLSRHGRVAFVDPSRYLCGTHCLVVRSGHPMYRDDDHLSTFGSDYLSPAFDGVFAKLSLALARTPASGGGMATKQAVPP